MREPVIDGVPFYAKYLGSTLVQKASGEEATADAIKTIIAMARGKRLPHVKLTISLRGIHMVDMGTGETRLEVSIYRISYCSADATYDRVFAFISTNRNETLECHAFLCPKRKMVKSCMVPNHIPIRDYVLQYKHVHMILLGILIGTQKVFLWY